MPIAIRDKRPQPISKTEAFKKYTKREGHHHKADPNHPMNAERTGPPRKKGGTPPEASKKKAEKNKKQKANEAQKKARRYLKKRQPKSY